MLQKLRLYQALILCLLLTMVSIDVSAQETECGTHLQDEYHALNICFTQETLLIDEAQRVQIRDLIQTAENQETIIQVYAQTATAQDLEQGNGLELTNTNSVIQYLESQDQEYELEQKDIQGEATVRLEARINPSTDITNNQPTDTCGDNGAYLKLCYYPQSIHPHSVSNAGNAVSQFVSRTANQVQDGYVLIVFAPEDRIIVQRDEQRVRIARERKIRTTTQDILDAREYNTKLLVASYAEPSGENNSAAAYLIPDYNANNNDLVPVQKVQQYATNTPWQAPEELARNQLSFEQVWQNQWENEAAGFRESDELTQLAQQIREEIGITVYFVTKQDAWTVEEQHALNQEITQQIRQGNSNAHLQTNPYDIRQEMRDHPRPCAVYVLLEPAQVNFYQSNYCRLTYDSQVAQEMNPTQRTARFLQSALRNTDPQIAQEMYLSAYGLAEKNVMINPHLSEAEALAYWTTNTEFFAEEPEEKTLASQEIIRAKLALNNNNPQSALTLTTQNIEEAYTELQPIGAKIALDAANQLGDCQQIQTIVQEYQEYLNQRGNEQRRAQQLLRECQERIAREQCEVVENSQNQNSVSQLEITYLNDRIPQDRFEELTQRITQQILETENIDEHAQDITFKRTPSLAPIATTRGYLRTPQVDSQSVARATRYCHGDTVLILSEESYLPITAGNYGYISLGTCNSAECMSLYSLRSIAFSSFALPEYTNTVTGVLTLNPADVRVELRLNQVQQRMIDEYFGGTQ